MQDRSKWTGSNKALGMERGRRGEEMGEEREEKKVRRGRKRTDRETCWVQGGVLVNLLVHIYTPGREIVFAHGVMWSLITLGRCTNIWTASSLPVSFTDTLYTKGIETQFCGEVTCMNIFAIPLAAIAHFDHHRQVHDTMYLYACMLIGTSIDITHVYGASLSMNCVNAIQWTRWE